MDEQTGTGAETSAGSTDLRSELGTAFDGLDTGAGDSTGTLPASGQATDAAVLEPPQHWDERQKQAFLKVDPEVRQLWLEREKQYSTNYDTRAQELAKIKGAHGEIEGLFAPYRQQMELHGISIPQAVKQMVAAQAYLLKSPKEAIPWLAKQYGVDLAQLIQQSQGSDANLPPEITSIRESIGKLENTVNGFMTQAQQAEHKQHLSSVQSFAEEKDEAGNPKHPHFYEVAQDIADLMSAARQRGGALSLANAYARAVRMNDKTWEKVQAGTAAQAKAKADAEAVERANKAKRAGFGLNGGTAEGGASKYPSLRAELESLIPT
jgi:hypothetical protein